MTKPLFAGLPGAALTASATALLIALGAAAAQAQTPPASAPKTTKAAPKKAATPKAAAPKAAARKAAAPKTPKKAKAQPSAAPAAPAQPAAAAARPAASSAQRQANYIVAVVNDEPITYTELQTRIARAARQLQSRSSGNPPGEAELRREMLERLIAERAQLQYARESGITVDDSSLAQAELSIARQNQLPDVPTLHRQIEAEGISVKDFQASIREQVLLARLREREIEPRVHVTDKEVDAYIQEQTGQKASAGQDINLAMILVAVPENASADEVARLQARADDVARRAREGEDFASLARAYSDANNRGSDGGVLGLRSEDRYPPLFVDSVRRSAVGSITGPVRSGAGFHILKLLERKRSASLPDVQIPQTHASHILLHTGPSQSEQVAKARLADFKRRIESGQASFEQLARENSQDGSAAEGGDLGWAMPGQYVPEFEQAMNNLDAGAISEPVVSRFGVHLIKVHERRARTLSAAEQRQLARNVLRERKADEAFDTWSREVRGRAYVEYREPPQS